MESFAEMLLIETEKFPTLQRNTILQDLFQTGFMTVVPYQAVPTNSAEIKQN